ncbi:MAG: NUDIX hydrolase [Chloroflexota bacterium]
MTEKDSYQEFLETLPKKRMGAGCLIFDSRGRVLLVKPTYKPVWEIPGGVVELNESPKACCQREVIEEIGLAVPIGHLLVMDYNSQSGQKTESLMFIFDGGVLGEGEIAKIRLKPDELNEYGFFSRESLPTEMTQSLKNRVLAAWRGKTDGGAVYLENQITKQ